MKLIKTTLFNLFGLSDHFAPIPCKTVKLSCNSFCVAAVFVWKIWFEGQHFANIKHTLSQLTRPRDYHPGSSSGVIIRGYHHRVKSSCWTCNFIKGYIEDGFCNARLSVIFTALKIIPMAYSLLLIFCTSHPGSTLRIVLLVAILN